MEATTTYDNSAPPVVTLELEGPRPQRRWTVALRAILAIPHWIWWSILGVAIYFAVIVAWFAALVLGRMPDGIGTFLARATQYYGRVTAYGQLLLTDQYPSFALDEPDYAVSVKVPWGGRLNRAAVFFRMVLLVPAAIAYWFVMVGLSVCLVFIWLIVLIAGRVPGSLFEALAAALRYQLRLTAYAMMLTSEYPRGLFGDRGLASDVEAPLPMAPSAEALVPPTPTSSAWPVEGGAPVAAPRITSLVLSKAAKRILVLFIVLGAVFGVGMIVVSALAAGQAGQARDEIAVLYDDVDRVWQEYDDAVQGCAVTQGGLDCLKNAALEPRRAMAVFGNALHDVALPAIAFAAADEVDEEVGDVIDVLDQMLATAESADYQRLSRELRLERQQFDARVTELDDVLYNGF